MRAKACSLPSVTPTLATTPPVTATVALSRPNTMERVFVTKANTMAGRMDAYSPYTGESPAISA